MRTYFAAILLLSIFAGKLPSLSAAEAKLYTDLPALYQKAFQISARFDENILEVFLETKNGYHVYKESFSVKGENFELELVKDSVSFQALDPASKKLKFFYKDQNTFTFATKALNASADLSEILVGLQACAQENCLLPVLLRVPIEGTVGLSEPSRASDLVPLTSQNPETSTEGGLALKVKALFSQSKGALSFQILLILLFAGILTAISPCVAPLFPLTLGIFSRWSHHDNRRAFFLTLSYGFGIILFFAANGILSAATGSLFGSLTQNPYYLLALGIITLAGGLMFSGLIPFPFANFFLKLAGSPDTSSRAQSFGKLLSKSFLMGATLGLVASPCVGPILLAVLAWLSRELPRGDAASYAAGFFSLSVFGFGLALPFLILGHFYFRLHKRIQLGRYSFLVKQLGSGLLVLSSLFFLMPAYKILARTKSPSSSASSTESYTWETKPANRWLVVDFRADWCTACLEIEENILSQEKVKQHMKDFDWSLVTVDMTDPERYQKLADDKEVISLPTLIFLKPDGTECSALRLNEVEDQENFLKRLKACQS